MKSISIKKLYMIHSWVGLVTGILLFVIAFTGAMAVFGRPEIKIWANPEQRSMPVVAPAQIEQVIAKHAADLPSHFLEEILVFLPNTRSFPNLTVVFENHDEEQAILFKFDNESLAVVERKEGTIAEVFGERQLDIADFIVEFHADLHLGRPIGLLLTGLLGLTLMASVVTGFIIHRQKLKQLFTFRRKKNFEIKLADSHKLFGVWGLIFHGVIAFTGAFLGLATVILIPAAAFVTFEGDQEKLVETFTTVQHAEMSGVPATTQLATILEHAITYDEDMRVELLTIYAYGDENATVYANAVGSKNVARQLLAYDGPSGDFKEIFGQFGKVGGVTSKILDLMFPLHYGNFGGVFVKLIWTILGLSTALLPLSGLMLWIERGQRSASSHFSASTYARFNKLVIGSCGGIVLACAALFPIQLAIHALAISASNTVIFSGFFATWFVAVLLPFTLQEGLASRLISYATGVLLIATIPLNYAITGDNLISLLIEGAWIAGMTDLTLLTLGIATLYLTKRLSNPSQSHNETVIDHANQQEA